MGAGRGQDQPRHQLWEACGGQGPGAWYSPWMPAWADGRGWQGIILLVRKGSSPQLHSRGQALACGCHHTSMVTKNLDRGQFPRAWEGF